MASGGFKDYSSGNPHARASKLSKLIQKEDIDEPDDLDHSWSEHFKQFKSLVSDKPEAEINSLLQQKNLDRPETANHYCTALIYAILTQENYPKYLRHLNHIVRDGFAHCISQLKRLINEKYSKLLESCKKQLLWLISEFVKLNVRETDILCCNLLRQIPGGDVSDSSIWLADKLLTLFMENKSWLYMSSELIPYSVYTFTRIIVDHSKPVHSSLKDKEVRFCVEVIREKFADCRTIGRDFVRLLQDLTKIPQFSDLWKDILQRPQSLSSQFTDLTQLFATRTPRKFLQSRVTPDMEKLLLFIMQKVAMGNQKRYQQWFAQAYLNTPESETLIVDLIRYICCVYHPSNVILSSDIVPRWAVIGWLLNSLKTTTIQANAKLALFYDWFFFNPQVDNIMNIEPGMLLMMHSIPKYAPFTAQLLEFILVIMDIYYPANCDIIRRGIHNSLHIMLTKGVVPSLEPLINCGALAAPVRQKAINCFAPFLPGHHKPEDKKPQAPPRPPQQNNIPKQEPESTPMEIDTPNNEPAKDVKPQSANLAKTIEESNFAAVAEKLKNMISGKAPMSTLLPAWRALLNSFCSMAKDAGEAEINNSARIIAEFALSELGDIFCQISGNNLYFSRIGKSESPLIDEIHSQYFTSSNDGKQNLPMKHILLELRKIEPRLGFQFLIYLCAKLQQTHHKLFEFDKLSPPNKLRKLKKSGTRKEQLNHLQSLLGTIPEYDTPNDSPGEEYFKSYLAYINGKKSSILQDCKLCAETDSSSFFWMLPQLCKYVDDIRCPEFIHIIVAYSDPSQFSQITGSIIKGSYQLFEENTSSIISSSLTWSSYEQELLWQLLNAEYPRKELETAIPKLLEEISESPSKFIEALGGMTLILRDFTHPKIIETIITLPESFKFFPTDLLSHWFDKEPKETISTLSSLCKELCDLDSRDLIRAKNLLLHLTVWIFRSPNNVISKIPSSFINMLSNLINEFDDDHTYSNLLVIISNKQKAS